VLAVGSQGATPCAGSEAAAAAMPIDNAAALLVKKTLIKDLPDL
jgi:hypothetical protein